MILNETQRRSITRDYSTETSSYSDYTSVCFLLSDLWRCFPWTHLILYRFKLVGYTSNKTLDKKTVFDYCINVHFCSLSCFRKRLLHLHYPYVSLGQCEVLWLSYMKLNQESKREETL